MGGLVDDGADGSALLRAALLSRTQETYGVLHAMRYEQHTKRRGRVLQASRRQFCEQSIPVGYEARQIVKQR